MEYEKHIKRLVLGYLKNECKNAYKVFLKYNFQNQHKHIPTRVAGQTLEDILRVYSHIQEIVQGRIEDTNYYKERSADFASPFHLDDQLRYLLDKEGLFTPDSTPWPGSPAESSVVETHHDSEVITTHISDVETTPEHTLPGNISSNDENYQSTVPFRRKSGSPIFTTPCMEKLLTSDKEIISGVMTQKLLENTEFHEKLAYNINSALNTPEIPTISQIGENPRNKDGIGAELDKAIIENAIKRTEADPMFEDLLKDFQDTPIVNTIGKTICAESSTSTSSSITTIQSTIPSKSWQHIDDHNNTTVSSILSVANVPNSKSTKLATTNDNMVYNDNLNNVPEPLIHPPPQIGLAPNLTSNQYLLPTSGGMYIVPQTATTPIQSSNQQQQFYIVNQPIVLPQTSQMVQLIQPAIKPMVIQSKQTTTLTKGNTHLTEQDLMAMPTIILNERNEITYADSGSFPLNTPLKLNEAGNIKEYLSLYGASDQSPILKPNPQKIKCQKSQHPLKPMPTIKVEILNHNTPITAANMVQTSGTSSSYPEDLSSQLNTGNSECTGLPNLNETFESVTGRGTLQDTTNVISEDITEAANNKSSDSLSKTNPQVVNAICTPSPLKAIMRKPTPKSGSHVRNLSFPSPVRKTSEKPDARRNSPRVFNKQQASKDLFGNNNKEKKSIHANSEEAKQSTKTIKTPLKADKNMKNSKNELPRSLKKDAKRTSKKPVKNEITEDASSRVRVTPKCSWDFALRRKVGPIVEEHNTTPVRKTSIDRRKLTRQTAEVEVVDPDGQKLEEALKTPKKKIKSKRKTASRRKVVETSNNKKLEEKPETVEIKGETKILSPSKLNANKRNILPNDMDDVTPDTLKEPLQYPISSKTRRNINDLLETPLKGDIIPHISGTVPDKSDTPFTPMLKANLKDFTEGDTFSIDTPNFPVTPGLAVIENASAAYYMLNDDENNKATEAIVRSEEKKSSVRKSDEEDVELSPRVYGSKEILENFNKNFVGKKNLELLDNRGVKWDGSSDKEDKSDENSENNSDNESNNTIVQNQKIEQPKQIIDSPKKSEATGKCMALLQCQLLKETSNREDVKGNQQNHEEDKGGGQSSKEKLPGNKITKSCSSGSDSEVLSKKDYQQKSNRVIANSFELAILSTDSKSEVTCELDDDVPENKVKDNYEKTDPKKECNERNTKIPENNYCITQEVVRGTITNLCLEKTSGFRSTSNSFKAQLEEKKNRIIKLEKSLSLTGSKKNSGRRSSLKSQPKFNLEKSKRKSSSPKKMVQPFELNQEKEPEGPENNNKISESNIKENEPNKKSLESQNPSAKLRRVVITQYHTVDSQDEFFKKSGTNLHRKNKENTTEKDTESSQELTDDIKNKTRTGCNILTDDEKLNKTLNSELEDDQNEHKNSKELSPAIEKSNDKSIDYFQKEDDPNLCTKSDNTDEFEKSWDCCDFYEFESEHLVLCYDESKTSNKQLEDYDFKILQKKIELGLPCSNGSTVGIKLMVSSFDTLLEIEASDECQTTDGSRDEGDSSFENLKRVPDSTSDSENAGYKTDDGDEVNYGRKRKHRSDSCNSNSSTKRKKPYVFLNENNIEKLLTKLHGPS